jgi:hypothetical protein
MDAYVVEEEFEVEAVDINEVFCNCCQILNVYNDDSESTAEKLEVKKLIVEPLRDIRAILLQSISNQKNFLSRFAICYNVNAVIGLVEGVAQCTVFALWLSGQCNFDEFLAVAHAASVSHCCRILADFFIASKLKRNLRMFQMFNKKISNNLANFGFNNLNAGKITRLVSHAPDCNGESGVLVSKILIASSSDVSHLDYPAHTTHVGRNNCCGNTNKDSFICSFTNGGILNLTERKRMFIRNSNMFGMVFWKW